MSIHSRRDRSPHEVRILDSAGPVRIAGKIQEIASQIEVRATGDAVFGTHRAELTVHYGRGVPQGVPILWQVDPDITVQPRTLVLKKDEPSRSATIVLRSDARAFRVLSVEPATDLASARFDTAAGQVHPVSVLIERSRARSRDFTLTIRTDHPDQPEIKVPVLFLSAEVRDEGA